MSADSAKEDQQAEGTLLFFPDGPQHQGLGDRLSWANFLESVIVVEARQGRDATRDLDLLIDGAGIELVPSDQDQVRRAVRAWRRFGKGHPAALNYGDCFAYATASMHDAPLLFTGNDFSQTDLRAVQW